jgi:molybdate transport system ATP-binding protein
MCPRMLTVDLQYRRGGFTLTAKVDFGAGVTGICGPSGSGKSTLLALIAGTLRPAQGRVRFDDESLVDRERSLFVPPWERHFGLVFQEGLLFPHLSVRDNLLYGYRHLAPSQRRFAPQSVLDLLEIGALVDRRPAQLSGGERQRVALGRALLYSPRLLMLDEPLSSLDDRLKQQILPFLKRVRDETHLPMIYVTHARAEVEFLADRVLAMEHGTLLEKTSG